MGGMNIELPTGNWFKYLVVASLFSGAGGNLASLNKDTSDRFKGQDFNREIAIRDHDIIRLQSDVLTLERERVKHLEHSAKHTQIIYTLQRRVQSLEGSHD